MRTKNRLLVAAMVSALTLTSLTGCGSSSGNSDKASSDSSSSADASSSGNLSGSVATDGSTSMEKVVGALGEAFMEANPDVKFTYNPTGSGSGITAVTEGRCDIGLSSRALTDDEKNQFWSLSVKSAKRSLPNWSRVSSVYSKSRFLSRQWSRLK